jgi:hypothetical protein
VILSEEIDLEGKDQHSQSNRQQCHCPTNLEMFFRINLHWFLPMSMIFTLGGLDGGLKTNKQTQFAAYLMAFSTTIILAAEPTNVKFPAIVDT